MDRNRLVKLLEAKTKGTNFITHCLSPLTEADFDQGNRTVKVTVLKAGWSKNGVYYPVDVLDQVKTFITGMSRKVYMDHTEDGKIRTRSMADWVADVVSASVEGDELKAVIKVHNNGPNAWVYDRMQTSDVVFGPSIVGVAEVKNGEADGIKGKIVQRIRFIQSFDIVSSPAAGGKVDQIMESVTWRDDMIEETKGTTLGDYLQKMKDREIRWETRSQIMNLTEAVLELICDLILAEDVFANVSTMDRKGLLDKAIEDFGNQLKKVKMLEPETADPGDGEDTTESVKPGGENTDITESQAIHGKDQSMEFKNLEEFRKANPELCESISKEVIAAHKASTKEADEAATADLVKRATDAEAKVAEADNKVVALEAEKVTLQEKLNTYVSAEIQAKRADIVSAVIKETELPEFALTELFKESLSKIAFDPAKEEEFKEAIKALCADRKSVIKEAAPAPAPAGDKKIDTGTLFTAPKKVVTESTGVTVDKGKELLGL